MTVAVAAIEAFEDAGVDYPVMTGEDEMSFLRKWEDTGLTGLAPVYSNFQWRTPLLAVQKIFAGEEVPAEWVLPQVPITEDERADYLAANDGMPDGHYAKFGGEDLPGYPEVWQERQIPDRLEALQPAMAPPSRPGQLAHRRQHLGLGLAPDRRDRRRPAAPRSPPSASTRSSSRWRTRATCRPRWSVRRSRRPA